MASSASAGKHAVPLKSLLQVVEAAGLQPQLPQYGATLPGDLYHSFAQAFDALFAPDSPDNSLQEQIGHLGAQSIAHLILDTVCDEPGRSEPGNYRQRYRELRLIKHASPEDQVDGLRGVVTFGVKDQYDVTTNHTTGWGGLWLGYKLEGADIRATFDGKQVNVEPFYAGQEEADALRAFNLGSQILQTIHPTILKRK